MPDTSPIFRQHILKVLDALPMLKEAGVLLLNLEETSFQEFLAQADTSVSGLTTALCEFLEDLVPPDRRRRNHTLNEDAESKELAAGLPSVDEEGKYDDALNTMAVDTDVDAVHPAAAGARSAPPQTADQERSYRKRVEVVSRWKVSLLDDLAKLGVDERMCTCAAGHPDLASIRKLFSGLTVAKRREFAPQLQWKMLPRSTFDQVCAVLKPYLDRHEDTSGLNLVVHCALAVPRDGVPSGAPGVGIGGIRTGLRNTPQHWPAKFACTVRFHPPQCI